MRYAAQLVGSLIVIAAVPGNAAKLLALLAVWALTFGRLTRAEAVCFVLVCALFSAMNLGALRQGVFFFTHPDFLGMPVWEFFMWGFYVLHLLRMAGGPPPEGRLWLPLALAVAFAVPFSTIADAQALLLATAILLAIALGFFHARLDLAYAGYMILVGALVEYTGVWSGQWGYPGAPPGGVPLWFVTMWGGVGLFTRRLVLPILRRYDPLPS
ncbi:MAG: hypothetical protein IT515_13935 [Burkholderiales bacterium]|nr:hypothetical protein [Burkholderiales bacterium]